jgi:membrane-bound lytic murein transglycosylase D
VDLRRVAEWTETSIDEIQSLNPELRRWTTPVKYPDYEVKVPLGTASLLRERLNAGPDTELSTLKWHTVRRGETVASIARRFRVAKADLAEANTISVRSRLRAGEELLIPRAPAPLLASRVSRSEPGGVTVRATRELGGAASMVESEDGSDVTRVVYRVKRGDTLSSIARLYRTTVHALRQWNAQLRGSRITPGDRLTIYASRSH